MNHFLFDCIPSICKNIFDIWEKWFNFVLIFFLKHRNCKNIVFARFHFVMEHETILKFSQYIYISYYLDQWSELIVSRIYSILQGMENYTIPNEMIQRKIWKWRHHPIRSNSIFANITLKVSLNLCYYSWNNICLSGVRIPPHYSHTLINPVVYLVRLTQPSFKNRHVSHHYIARRLKFRLAKRYRSLSMFANVWRTNEPMINKETFINIDSPMDHLFRLYRSIFISNKLFIARPRLPRSTFQTRSSKLRNTGLSIIKSTVARVSTGKYRNRFHQWPTIFHDPTCFCKVQHLPTRNPRW